jgi:uncharacterized membrane protein YqiK
MTRLEKIAEANRNRVILEAEAEAEAIKIKGDAEAFSMAAKGKAEAEQLTMKAEAYRFYKDAAMVEMLLDVLPKVMFFSSHQTLANVCSTGLYKMQQTNSMYFITDCC